MRFKKVLYLVFGILLLSNVAYAQYGQEPGTYLTVTITGGLTETSAIDIYNYKFAQIVMPTSWTAANLTFKTSPTIDGTYQSLYDDAGVEVNVTAAVSTNIAIDVNALKLAASRFLVIRSGTAATPVTQASTRTLYLILK